MLQILSNLFFLILKIKRNFKTSFIFKEWISSSDIIFQSEETIIKKNKML